MHTQMKEITFFYNPEAGLKKELERFEKDLIRKALQGNLGVVAYAANDLKIERTTLLQKILKYDIKAHKYTLYDSHVEKFIIVRALKQNCGFVKKSARDLNIKESTMRCKIKRYGINRNLYYLHDDHVRKYILFSVLKRHNGNIREIAREYGTSVPRMQAKIDKHGIDIKTIAKK